IRELATLQASTRDPDLAVALEALVRPLTEAHEGAERIMKVVADLRQFNRAERLAMRSVDLSGCLDWALKVTQNQIRHVARLRTDLGRMPPVMGNDVRLSQVFVNLLVNAAHAIRGRVEDNEGRV